MTSANSQQPTPSRLDLVKKLNAQGITSGADLTRPVRMVVSIDKLQRDPKNARKTAHGLDELRRSIEKHGIIDPIIVAPSPNDMYRIRSGDRRFLVAKQLGFDQIEIIIRPDEGERGHRVKGLVSNIQREDVPPLELAESIKALLDEFGLSQDDVAEELGKHKTWVSGVLRILNLPTRAKDAVGRAQLAVSADSLIRIARLDDQALQVELVERLVTGDISRQEVRKRIEEAKGGKKVTVGTKPKRAFSTTHDMTIIAQSNTDSINSSRIIAALEEALVQAKAADIA